MEQTILTTLSPADLKNLMREVLREEMKKQDQGAKDELLNRKEAAKELGYKCPQSLNTWHYKGLTPIRRGKYLFYDRGEVERLKLQLFK